jgi:hypothetical protein
MATTPKRTAFMGRRSSANRAGENDGSGSHRKKDRTYAGVYPQDSQAAGSFDQGTTAVIKRIKNIWFVSFKNINSRMTKTFANESDAKRFARSKNGPTDQIYAGTINPHKPKRTITSAQIVDWLEEG